jgi:hypothetical protein
MKKTGFVALISIVAATALFSSAVQAQTSVGVSIGINQPGVYGRINIGNYPQPVLVAPQPVIIAAAPVAVQRQPIYLYVPPGHQQNWGKHCMRYNACGQPVYFVQEQWVRERYQHEHPGWRGERHGREGRGEERREERRENHGPRHGGHDERR